MSTTHWFLQGKGGVGKSLAACLLAQYYLPDKSINVSCYDADPIVAPFVKPAQLRLKVAKREFYSRLNCLAV